MKLKTRFSACIIMFLSYVVSLGAQAPQHPLTRGIRDVQARIDRNNTIIQGLTLAISGHLEKLGEILYDTSQDKKDPIGKILKIKQAVEALRKAYDNGTNGRVEDSFGQLGQALLDFGSEPTFRWLAPYQKSIEALNASQQLAFEAGRLWTTWTELEAYKGQVDTDTRTLQYLQDKVVDIEARQGTDSNGRSDDAPAWTPDDIVIPNPEMGANQTTLDDAILIARWLDLGDRAFNDEQVEEDFYKRFPAFAKFRSVAETRSPRTEVEKHTNPCWACPECSSPKDNLVCRGCCEGE